MMEALAVKTKQDPSILNEDGKEVIKTTDFEYQDVLEFARLPLPQCTQPNDVLIQVAYSDVNPVDLQRLQHNIKNPKRNVDVRLYARDGSADTPFITGHGGTGIVIQVGDQAPRHLIGKTVCFLGDPSRPGSYATHVVADARSVAVMPPSLAQTHLREAATIPVAGLTAYESLSKVGLLASDIILKKNSADSDKSSKEDEEGASSLAKVGAAIGGSNKSAVSSTSNASNSNSKSSLLIVGGSGGGVGSWCIALAHAWHPHLEIYATASTEHEDWCYQLGALKVCRHDPDDITRTCLQGRDAKQGSIDAIICLTEPTPKLFGVLADVIKPYGTICLVVSGDFIQKMDLSFCFFKCVNIATQTVFSSMRTNFQIIHPQDELEVILQLLAVQKIKVPLSPMLQEGKISEKFKHILHENGILNMLAQKTMRKYCGKLILCINADSNVILVDCKTASLVSLPRVDCIAQNIVPWEKSKNGLEGWKDAAHGAERDNLVKILKDHEALGILPAIEKTVVAEMTLMESENIKNLWGVSLKKRERNKKGEEVIFLDPRTETLVELSRADLIAKKVLTMGKDSVGKEIIQENVANPSARDDIVQAIRKSLHLLGESTTKARNG